MDLEIPILHPGERLLIAQPGQMQGSTVLPEHDLMCVLMPELKGSTVTLLLIVELQEEQ